MPDINNIVRVTATIAEQGVLRRVFGIGLFVTTDTTLGTGSRRVGTFSSTDAVDEVFATGTEPAQAASIWFQQSPYPRNLVIGRWINTASNARLLGGTHGTLAALTAISDGAFEMNGEQITGLDFSADTSFTEVAAALQVALQAATNVNLTDSTVTYNAVAQRFEIDNQVPGSTSTLTFASTPSAGTDISTLLGWTAATGAVIDQGADAETIEEALAAIQALNDSWYFVTLEQGLNDSDTVNDVSAWVASREYMFAAESNDATVLTTGEGTSTFAELFAIGSDRTFGDYTPATSEYLAVSSAARLSSVNFSGSNTLINPKFKSRPGLAPAGLTGTQVTELNRKLVNYFTTFGTDSIYVEGTTFKPGVFQDVRFWVDWFVNAIRVDVYNLLRQSARVPQTNAGHTAIQRVVEAVCQMGVTNGGLAPGQLSAALTLDVQQATGNADFDGFLPAGYLVYFTPLAQQSQADRNARMASPFRVWAKGSGAINSVDISITFEN